MIGDELRTLREHYGVSQQGLANLLGIGKWGKRTIRRWENGEVRISARTALAVKSVLLHRLPA